MPFVRMLAIRSAIYEFPLGIRGKTRDYSLVNVPITTNRPQQFPNPQTLPKCCWDFRFGTI